MNRLKELTRRFGFLLYPLLFALFPLLSFYGSNYAEIKAGNFSLSVFFLFNIVVAVLAWLIAFAATRNTQKASLLSVVMLIVFFMFGRLHDSMTDVVINTPIVPLGPTKILLIIGGIIVVGAWLIIRKVSSEKVAKIGQTLTLVAVVMVASTLLTIGTAMASTKDTKKAETKQQSTGSSDQQQASGDQPDVYYILLDGYTRQDQLKEHSDYDNAPFIEGLRSRGFYVADKANSNYAHTHWSVPSTFNMKYLNYLVEQQGKESSDRRPLRDLTVEHQAAKEFKSLGYKYVNIGSQWGWTMKSPQSDIEIESTAASDSEILNIPLNEFTLVYMQTTALKPFISTGLRSTLVSRILGSFERVEKVPAIKEPTFTFAHIVSPHPPYLFDENGLIPNKTPLELDNEGFSDRAKFTAQTTYVNNRIHQLVDKIIAESDKPPVIIIASDHGSAAGLTPSDFDDIDPAKLNESGVKERMGILNAYYFPDKNYTKLYPSISPVNSFRLVLSQYFGKDYPLLPDTSYFSGNKDNNEYKLFDVTKLVNPDAEASTTEPAN